MGELEKDVKKDSEQDFELGFKEFIAKYAELLTGDSSPEVIEKVQIYALYSHIHKTMPALAKHWLADNPEAKAKIKQIFEEIQKLNQQIKK